MNSHDGPNHEQHQRVAIYPVTDPLPETERPVFLYGQRCNVAVTPAVKVAGRGMVQGVLPAPVVVRRQRQHAEQTPDPVVDLAGTEQRTMPAIMLNDEHAHQQCTGKRRKRPRGQHGILQQPVHQGPNAHESCKCNDDFKHCPAVISLTIWRETRHPGGCTCI
jgi:hypothetical protein